MPPSTMRPVFLAVPFDATTDADKPLLELTPADVDNDHVRTRAASLDDDVFGKFKTSSLILGLLIGFFIQFSTLGANFLVITLWGEDVVTKSKADIVVFSLLWSFFTSAMAILILGFLRNLVTITYTSMASHSHDLLEEMVIHMECRFVVGALVGVCTAWTLTDVLLGMHAQILYSLMTLLIALFWCRIMMRCFSLQEEGCKSVSATEYDMITV